MCTIIGVLTTCLYVPWVYLDKQPLPKNMPYLCEYGEYSMSIHINVNIPDKDINSVVEHAFNSCWKPTYPYSKDYPRPTNKI